MANDILRIKWVDNAKGIAIILVVMGHVFTTPLLHGLIYSVHLPLFFFLSGLFVSKSFAAGFKYFVYRRFKTIIVPYIAFSMINILYFDALSYISGIDFLEAPLNKRVIGTLFGLRIGWNGCFGYLWFLPLIFSSQLLLYPVFKLKGIMTQIMVVCMYLFLGLVYAFLIRNYAFWSLPYNLDAALIASFFMYVGHLVNHFRVVELCLTSSSKLRSFWLLIIFAVLWFLGICFSWDGFEMYNATYNTPLISFLTALFGIASICALSSIYQQDTLSKWGGDNHHYLYFT